MVGACDRILHEGYIWTGPRSVLSFILHKPIFIHFVHHGTRFHEKNIYTDNIKIYIDDYESGIFPKQKDRKLYNTKYQETYVNRCHVLS